MDRIKLDERKLRALFDEQNWYLPAIDVESPAGDVVQIIDTLIDREVIVLPAGFRLSVLNDDGTDICGLIVNVEVTDGGWPYISDGWSDIDNYLPSVDDTPKPEDTAALEAAYREMVAMVLGRADRCIQFAQKVQRAFELADDVASSR